MENMHALYDCLKDRLKEIFQEFADEQGFRFEYIDTAFHVVDYPTWYIRFVNEKNAKNFMYRFDTSLFNAMVNIPETDLIRIVCLPIFQRVREELLEVEHE